LSIHGGEEFRNNSNLNFSASATDSSQDKNKNLVNRELNVLDKLISENMILSDELINDVHKENELKNNSKHMKKEPTPVTLANIKGGKKDRQNKYEGLRVLIDTGCSHSIVADKYTNKKQTEKNKKIFYRKWNIRNEI
jgi:hypothetical protein